MSEINGMSARNILNYLVTGKKLDEAAFDKMRQEGKISNRLKAPKPRILDDLNGVLSPLQRRVMKELLSHLDELNEHIRNLDDEIDRFMKPEEHEAAAKIQDVPGIGPTSAQTIGTDMSRFPTDRHISSWAGVCPGNNESAGKRRSGKTRKGNSMLRTTLLVCAHSATKVKSSYFYAHRGKKRAYLAVAHSILIAIYHILKDGIPFHDLGADYYNQFNKESKIRACLQKLHALGWSEPTATAVAPV